METNDIKVCVLVIEGTNCEEESFLAFKHVGAAPEKVHLNQLDSGRRRLDDYHILFIPGGFSSGDYIRAGAIFASRFKARHGKELKQFVENGRLVLGVCNGFQVLVEMGLLPAVDEIMAEVPVAALTTNDSGRFECRPTLLKHVNNGKCAFTSKIPKDKVLLIPSAHAEGKLTFPYQEEEYYLGKLIEQDQIVFRYVDPNGVYAGYPWNPNGSIYNIAGMCNRTGNVLGMMPHPERVFFRYQHPDWTRTGLGDERGDGRLLFESAVAYIIEHF